MTAPTVHTIVLPNGHTVTRRTKVVRRFAIVRTNTDAMITEMYGDWADSPSYAIPAPVRAVLAAHAAGEWTGQVEGMSNVRKNAERVAANIAERSNCPTMVVELTETPQGGLHVDLTPSIEDLSVETIVEEAPEAPKAPKANTWAVRLQAVLTGDEVITLTAYRMATLGWPASAGKHAAYWGANPAGKAARSLGYTPSLRKDGESKVLTLTRI